MPTASYNPGLPVEKSISYSELQSALRIGLPYVAIAAICLAAGLGAISLSMLRGRDRLLLWVGVFSTMYGLRLFWADNLVRAAAGARSMQWPVDIITYTISIPTALFFLELLGPGWKSSIRVWLWTQLVFAPTAILVAVITGHRGPIDLVNSTLVIASLALTNAHLFTAKWRSITPALAWSLIVFGILVVATNLGFGRAPLPLEPIGFLVMIFGLAYTAAERAIARDKKFVAVASELATARRIQTSILPRSLPEIPGLRLAALYSPMTEVAGDFYDFIRLDDQRLTILIADVSGHGVPAALIASMLKVAFAHQAAHAADPSAVLAGLNQILAGVVDGQFVTAACAHLDLAGAVITYAGAGHPPALLRHASGEIAELAENGLFLGPFRHAKYQNIRAPFQQGDSLLLYTDGIVEATLADGEPFGDARLREFFAARGAGEPAGTADALLQAVARPEQEDDLTVIIAAA